jgi:nicotinate phosphoribosyltransferase
VNPSGHRSRASADAALFTDLYELTMAAAYLQAGMNGAATFELFVRELPPQRRFLVVSGVEAVLDLLESLRFTADHVAYLGGLGLFPPAFLEQLRSIRFDGEVWAIPEGEVAYAGEPIVRVTASLPVAQLVETYLLNAVASHTLVASKAARVALACAGRSFVDFSARRDHGPDAAMQAATSSWIGGADGTSLVLAGMRHGLPLTGTMAHSFVMAHDDEREAFLHYARCFPYGATLLIDTYDTVQGARTAVEVARELAPEGITIRGVRLDSGDLDDLSRRVRAVLDAGGLDQVRIVASGDLDEHRIDRLVRADAPIDAFGVGTQLGTSADAPSLGAVYKLVEAEGAPRLKLAEGKRTLPGRKQVWRLPDRDVLAVHHEAVDGGRPLLERRMDGGRRTGPAGTLDAARTRCRAALAELPAAARRLGPAADGEEIRPVVLSPGLRRLRDDATRSREARHG